MARWREWEMADTRQNTEHTSDTNRLKSWGRVRGDLGEEVDTHDAGGVDGEDRGAGGAGGGDGAGVVVPAAAD